MIIHALNEEIKTIIKRKYLDKYNTMGVGELFGNSIEFRDWIDGLLVIIDNKYNIADLGEDGATELIDKIISSGSKYVIDYLGADECLELIEKNSIIITKILESGYVPSECKRLVLVGQSKTRIYDDEEDLYIDFIAEKLTDLFSCNLGNEIIRNVIAEEKFNIAAGNSDIMRNLTQGIKKAMSHYGVGEDWYIRTIIYIMNPDDLINALGGKPTATTGNEWLDNTLSFVHKKLVGEYYTEKKLAKLNLLNIDKPLIEVLALNTLIRLTSPEILNRLQVEATINRENA